MRPMYPSSRPSASALSLQRVAGLIRQLKAFDDRRPSVPGEHFVAFGTGTALLLRGRRSASPVLRTLACAGGLLLMARGLSGRDGLLARLRRR
ncbi:hypothetical protein [Azohydromonas caseinilytica]|uniref:Uncharacterized protein n=1 Tax=Azohydromonas caseinilytica TaxID=2728836 RepID=A0A848F6F0_9BURK|nr:hypothetical protein [Azohydromonas caseinilytica]NML15667.1 hypothetical protein [Azohydromonas caseinilytica]